MYAIKYKVDSLFLQKNYMLLKINNNNDYLINPLLAGAIQRHCTNNIIIPQIICL